MKKFIAMLLVVALTCSNFIGFSGSDTVYASQNSSGLNEDETTVTSATNVSAEKTEITGQGTITDVHVNPLYEDSVEVQSVHYASLDYATSTLPEPEYVADLNVIAEDRFAVITCEVFEGCTCYPPNWFTIDFAGHDHCVLIGLGLKCCDNDAFLRVAIDAVF